MSLDDISIREVEEKDADFLFTLMNNTSVLKSLNEVPSSHEFWENAVSIWKKDADEEDYIILSDNIPTGWLGINNLESPTKQVYIKVIVLIPDKQGLGIGKYVIDNIIKDLKSRGYKSVGLYTDQSNINAQKCYQRCGFTVTDALKNQKMPNGKNVDRYKMELELA